MRFVGFGLFALFVLLALACTHVAFAQDDAISEDSVTSADSAPAPSDVRRGFKR